VLCRPLLAHFAADPRVAVVTHEPGNYYAFFIDDNHVELCGDRDSWTSGLSILHQPLKTIDKSLRMMICILVYAAVCTVLKKYTRL
jgi:hypothetical protein